MVFVVDKVALGQVFSEYFGFPCHSFNRLLRTPHHPSSTASTVCQMVADVPSGFSLTPCREYTSFLQFLTRLLTEWAIRAFGQGSTLLLERRRGLITIGSVCTWRNNSLYRENVALLAVTSRSRSHFTTDGQSITMSWYRASLWDLQPDILSCRNAAVWNLRSSFWLEDGSAICSVITQWSESLRTRNHTLLSHLRLSRPGGPGSRIYIPKEQGRSVIPPCTGFPLHRLLWLAGLRRR
jgi:hypothetical protein